MFNINNLKIRTKLLLTLLIGFKASAGLVPDPRKVIPLSLGRIQRRDNEEIK
jgi:hypothetical protein